MVGGEFGGLSAARTPRRAPVDVLPVDRRNHHVFQPLSYKVANTALSPGDIASPIRWILRRQRNVPYDYLVLHIYQLVGFRNRLSVMTQWAFAYLSYQRSVRLITEDRSSRSS